MGHRRFTVEQLITILAEVEAIVNTCPLTYAYDEFDSGFTLTPAHFLMSRFEPRLVSASNNDGNDNDYCIVKDSTTALLDSRKKGQQQLNCFWQVWRDECLLGLREKYCLYHCKEKNQTNMIRTTSWTSCCDQR